MSLRKILFVPDTHVPYHDKRAWALMCKTMRAWKPDTLVHIGDLADFYSVSAHDKDGGRANRMEWELEEVNRALDDLDALGATDKRFVEGNHCDRLRRYLQKHPELMGVVSTQKLLRLKERGWKFTPYKRTDKIGKCHLTHDVGASGRNSVQRALDTYQHTVITGHSHRFQYIVEGNALGEPKLSAAFGWLGDVEQIDYMHVHKAKKDWALGFGIGYLDPKTGYIYVVPVPIIDYSCMVEGKVYRG